MKKLVFIAFAVIVFTLNTNAQTTKAEQDLRDCAQFLEQSMDEAATCAAHSAAVEKLLAKTEEGEKNALKLAAERLVTIDAQAKTIERLSKIKCSTKTYFFFFKSKTCY